MRPSALLRGRLRDLMFDLGVLSAVERGKKVLNPGAVPPVGKRTR